MPRVKTSLRDILQAVPGRNFVEQARLCGVSRQTFHAWRNGIYGPNPRQALKLSQVTGFSINEIILSKYGLD